MNIQNHQENYLNEMFELQSELNVYIRGKDWKKGVTLNGNEIDWIRCMHFELVEAINESFQWKHWKNNDVIEQFSITNLHNFKIELVDTYHFLMSEILKIESESFILNYKDLFKEITVRNYSNKEYITRIENLILVSLQYGQEEENKKSLHLTHLFVSFWKIPLSVMTLEEFYSLYVSKNVLNLFRQKHGYKDGTYIKTWNGKEDNEYLKNILDTETSVNFQDIYTKLENFYKKIQ